MRKTLFFLAASPVSPLVLGAALFLQRCRLGINSNNAIIAAATRNYLHEERRKWTGGGWWQERAHVDGRTTHT